MTSLALPLVLLGLATGIAIAPAAPRMRAIAFVAFAVIAGVTARLPSPVSLDAASFAVWLAVASCAAAIHWPHAPRHVALVLACLGGGCAGVLASAAGLQPEGYLLPPAATTLVLASWCLRHDARVAVKVVASWLIAVVLLIASLHSLPVTPGDRPDHLE